MKKLLLPALLSIAAVQAQATIIEFDLIGTAGSGIRAGNETPAVTGGTGGEIGAGIFFNDVTLQLTVNVGWGSGNGAFTDLSSNVTNQHIHGPTAANFGFNGTANFTQTSGNTIALTRTSNSPVNGQISNNVVTLTAGQQADLFNGKFYINVHSANNPGGEARGFLVPAVPEPGTGSLLGLGALALAARRRRG